MDRTLLIVLVAIAMATPMLQTVAAGPAHDAGLDRACQRSANAKVCAKVQANDGEIPDTTVGAGQSRSYAGRSYTATGTVVVETGGSATVDQATIDFTSTSGGFIVRPGGSLIIRDSTFHNSSSSHWRIIADANSVFEMVRSSAAGGDGLLVSTNATTFNNNTLSVMPVALHMFDITVMIRDSAFHNNTVAVNQTGGYSTLANNFFNGGETCVRDWRSDPTITENIFRGCHIGIWHEQSESTLTRNDMEDAALPPGIGIAVIDTQSPIIEDNNIRNYGTGILVSNARAYIRNNSIHDNVGNGIRVNQNSLAMDIQGNHIYNNGGRGIFLHGAHDIPVFNNNVHDNGDVGILAVGSVNTPIYDNFVHNNGAQGIYAWLTTGTVIENNIVANHTAQGIVALDTDAGRVAGNTVTSSSNSGIYAQSNTTGIQIANNDVSGTNGIGIYVVTPQAQINGNTAHSNANEGIFTLGIGAVLTNNTAHHNNFAGIAVRGNSSTVSGAFVHNNTHSGVSIQLGVNMAVSDVVSRDNRVGLDVNQAQGTFDGIEASGNVDHGVWFQARSGAGFTTFDQLRSVGNGWAGFFNVWGNATTVHNSAFIGNAVAGVINSQGTAALDFRFNYWGSSTGPTHPSNPYGTGDEVQGAVEFMPWLTSDPTA